MKKTRVAVAHGDFIPGRPGEYDAESLRVVYGMLKEAVDAVGGMRSVIPPRSYVFVVGDCTDKHKDRGIFLPGCASTSMHRTFFPGKSSEEVLDNYRKVQPRKFNLEGYKFLT